MPGPLAGYKAVIFISQVKEAKEEAWNSECQTHKFPVPKLGSEDRGPTENLAPRKKCKPYPLPKPSLWMMMDIVVGDKQEACSRVTKS